MSIWASFAATRGHVSHTLDAWGKKIPPEFLQSVPNLHLG